MAMGEQGVTHAYINSTFSEYRHVAYQIKGNEACNNMQANILPINTPSTPRRGEKIRAFF